MMNITHTISRFKNTLRAVLAACALLALPLGLPPAFGPAPAMACGCSPCCGAIGSCASVCVCTSNKQTKITVEHITEAFNQHRKWMVDIFVKDERVGSQGNRDTVPGMLAALQIMTSQLTASTLNQIYMVGALLDAKHQLETQRVFQMLTAEAHKDYHPSEGLCEVGTMSRSLAASERRADLVQTALSNRMNERQLLSGDTPSANTNISDFWSRLKQFRTTFCNPNDNGKGLNNLCLGGGTDKTRYNRDIDFTATVDFPLTLKLDMTTESGKEKTADEENIFALSANLYANDPVPAVLQNELVNDAGEPVEGALKIMDVRALAAKRSVAQNSFATIVSQRAEGSPESSAFLFSALKQMSNEAISEAEIKNYLGDKPSYYAQMEMLTKKIYQHPRFFTELYDKPANVLRKEAAMQAINLMQKRDIYRSLLRSETLFSVILETSLMTEQDTIENEVERIEQDGGVEALE